MAEPVVCNASPLIFLAKIDRLSFLDRYRLHVPEQVAAEILKGTRKKKPDAAKIIDYLHGRNVSIEKVSMLRYLPHTLGRGERAVISLALRDGIKIVLIDEARARNIARFLGLNTKGTLGVLWDAYKEGAVTLEGIESLALDLIQSGYRIREELIVEFLKRIRSARE